MPFPEVMRLLRREVLPCVASPAYHLSGSESPLAVCAGVIGGKPPFQIPRIPIPGVRQFRMPKKSLRRAMLDRRSALAPDQWMSLSCQAQQRFLASELFAGADVLILYAPVRREVDTGDIMRAALDAGKKVLFPVVAGDGLLFREIAGDHDLVQGTFGIAEPRYGCPERSPDEADCIVVPGVAFDRSGRRIGYGKGFYDRTLHRLEGTGRLVGFCFDFQLVEEITGEPHDVALDLIITERQAVPVRSL